MKNKLIILLLVFFLLTGCGNYRELNEIAIITGIGIDKTNNEYEVSMLIANAGKSETSSKEGESQQAIYTGQGKTIVGAVKEIERKIPKQLYFGHINAVVISEKIAKEGFLNIADFLLRNPESRKKFYLLMAKGSDAKDILKIISPLESFPSQSIATLMGKGSKTQSITNGITYSDFVNKILTKGVEPILPSVSVIGDEKEGSEKTTLEETVPKAYLKLENTALFKGDKFIGYAENDDSQAINILKGEPLQSVFSIKYDDNYANITARNISAKIKLEKENKIIIKIKGDARLAEINSNVDLNKKETITKLKKDLNKTIKKQIENVIEKMQKQYKSDIFGFGNLVYKKYPNTFIEEKWNDVDFPKLTVEVNSDVNLISTGSLENTIRKENSK